MNKTKLLIIGGVMVAFALGVTQFLSPRQAVSPTIPTATSTSEQSVSTTNSFIVATTTVNIVKRPVANPLPIAKGDTVASWDFVGAYTNSPELIVKADAEIKRITDLLGSGTYPDMAIYVGIANQYELIGNGKKQYDFLIQAVRDGGTTSGLPWHNLGVLMERLGALETARIAYEKSTLVQPQFKFYHYAYLEFITKQMKYDVVDIEKAFTAANKYFATDADIIQLRAEWQGS
jgi:hypothetical protein